MDIAMLVSGCCGSPTWIACIHALVDDMALFNVELAFAVARLCG